MTMTLYTGSPSQQKALAIAPKVPALLSFLGSLYIAISVLRERKKLSSSNHRLLLGISACDMIVAVWWFMSSWAMPAGTWWQAAGNDGTCLSQAFMVQFSMANIFYNGSLGVYYFLVIRHGWNKQRIKKIEPFLHAVPLLMGLVPAFVLTVGLDIYEPFGPLCFMAQPAIGMIDNLLPILVGTVVTVLMFLMYRSVRQKEKAMERYTHRSSTLTSSSTNTSRNRLQKTRMVAIQGIFYCIPFYITWTPALVFTFLHQILEIPVIYELFVLFCILEPAQGFFNFLVYIRPNVMRYYRSRRKEAAKEAAARKARKARADEEEDPAAVTGTTRATDLTFPTGTETDGGALVDINDADMVNS